MSLSSTALFSRNDRAPGAGVTAVLGPTNTGKTHLAIERMLAHSSGIIGLPLRLLAREVYNKIVARVGPDQVALITGEEKIKPARARFWVSTVEAMPRDLDVSFLAVDEIQIAADLERGHVFTDRILNRRGRDETLLLGAATMRPLIERLLPGANIVTRPRLSQLEFAGDRKITRQPRRTAIVAFSADEVYAIAELIRRQHGGAAVVLGSLSPRTRNAQVEMFQSGDVDYLVATDAVGMGLNLDVDHVAFASDRKYDGYQFRRLNPAEFAQIAGRAGRAMRNGTFGTTGRCAPFEPELVNALQNHMFDSVKMLQWRNTVLDFSSVSALQVSLSLSPRHDALTRAPLGEDQRVLDHAARDPDVRDIAVGRIAVERLWDTCLVPDYRKLSPAAHAELVTTLFGFLMRKDRIPDEWFAAQVAQADRIDGDIDTLSARISQIRTWTFAANRPDWLADPEHWQGITRAVEDKLSDALHSRLTERFVDRRTSVLMRRLRENTMLTTEIGKTGEVTVEGHVIGRLDGFMFAPDAAEAGSEAKALQAAALKALAGEIDARAEKLASAADDQFALASDGTLRWTGDAVGKLVAADDVLHPRVRIVADERLSGASRDAVQARLDLWLKAHVAKILGPMFELSKAEDITGIARGIAFQLVESLGVIERQKIAAEMKDLDQAARATLRKYGVRFGAYHVFFPALLKPAARSLASLLWAMKQDNADMQALTGAQHLAASGRTSFPADKVLSGDAYRVLGYKLAGERSIRVDILERLADLIRPALSWRPGTGAEKPAGAFDGRSFVVTQAMTSLTGSAGEDFASVLRSLGYRMDRRPPLPEEPKPAEAAATEASVAAPETEVAATSDSDAAPAAEHADVVAVEAVNEDSASKLPDVSFGSDADTEVKDETPSASEAAPIVAETEAQAEIQTQADGTVVADEASVQAKDGAEAPAAEPVLVEVWRPAGRSDERRPRHNHQRHRDNRQPQKAAPAAEGAEGQQPAGDQAGDRRGPRHGRDRDRERNREDRRPRHEHKEGAQARPPREDRDGRPQREHFKGKGKRDRDGGRDRRDNDAAFRTVATTATRERGGVADPNSPFAKLAALKDQLSGKS